MAPALATVRLEVLTLPRLTLTVYSTLPAAECVIASNIASSSRGMRPLWSEPGGGAAAAPGGPGGGPRGELGAELGAELEVVGAGTPLGRITPIIVCQHTNTPTHQHTTYRRQSERASARDASASESEAFGGLCVTHMCLARTGLSV